MIAALARTATGDIERAAEALKGADHWRIHTFISTSDVQRESMLKMSYQQVLDAIQENVTLAKGYTEDVEFSAQDATRTELEFLLECYRLAVRCGATTINVPDTVGYATPTEFGELIRIVRQEVPDDVVISTHCHNDLGLAVANALAGIENGARQVEVAVNGIGERAGNCSLEEIAMIVRTRRAHLGVQHGLNIKEITRTSRLVAMTTGYSVQRNKAVVGTSAFAHESGIHQHGVLANRETYEIMDPVEIGLEGNQLVLGKHSGRHAFIDALDKLGITLDDAALNRAFTRFKDLGRPQGAADRPGSVRDRRRGARRDRRGPPGVGVAADGRWHAPAAAGDRPAAQGRGGDRGIRDRRRFDRRGDGRHRTCRRGRGSTRELPRIRRDGGHRRAR